MVKSMTAFARAEVKNSEIEISWEVKTLNQRYLEMTIRMPESLRQLEMKSRDLIQQRLGRGKIEANCRFRLIDTSASGLSLDNDKISAVIAACNDIEMQMGGIGKTLSALDVLLYPGVVAEKSKEIDENGLVIKALEKCLDELDKSRHDEGLRLQSFIMKRAEAIKEIVVDVRTKRVEIIDAIQNKLRGRVNELLEKKDNERLEQELVMIAQKMDVDEELDRIDSHLKELAEIFERNEPIGRRLDFLMQEFNREANTLGSKAGSIEATKAAVELKVLIEQMREQVQNIE